MSWYGDPVKICPGMGASRKNMSWYGDPVRICPGMGASRKNISWYEEYILVWEPPGRIYPGMKNISWYGSLQEEYILV
jgi:hypothetical protein